MALHHWRAAGSGLGQCLAKIRIATGYWALGEFDEALHRWREALDHCPRKKAVEVAQDPAVWLRATLPGTRAKAYLGIGSIYEGLGDSAKALDFAHKALLLSERHEDPRQQGDALQQIGAAYMDLGEPSRALGFFHRALSIGQTRRHVRRQAILWGLIGEAHDALDEPENALRAYRQALPLWRSNVGHYPRGLVGCLLYIGRAHFSLGQTEKALKFYIQALDLASTRERSSVILLDLADLYAAIGGHGKARAHYDEALRLSRQDSFYGSRQRALHGLARLARDRGRAGEALDWSRQMIGSTEDRWARILNPHLKGSYLASQQGYFEFHVDLLMALHRERPTGGYDVAAFEAAEGARARNLLEALQRAGEETLGADPASIEEERRLRHRLEAWGQRESGRIQAQNTLSDEQRQAEEVERTDLVTRYQEMVASQRKNPRYAALRLQRGDLRKIQREALAQDTLLLAYALGERRSFLWAVTAKTFDSFELPPRGEIESLARHFYDLVSGRSLDLEFEADDERLLRVKRADDAQAGVAARLSQLLLGPVASQLTGRRLLIVADGMLHYVPFAALPRPEKAAAENVLAAENASTALLEHSGGGVARGAKFHAAGGSLVGALLLGGLRAAGRWIASDYLPRRAARVQ